MGQWLDFRKFLSKSVLRVNPMLVGRWGRVVSSEDSSQPETPYNHLELARKNVWVYRGIRKIAESAASLPYQIWRKKPSETDGTERWMIVEDDPWAEALEYPNPYQSWYQLTERTFLSLYYLANAFWEKVPRAGSKELFHFFPLDAKLTAPIPDPLRLVAGFEFRIPEGGALPIPAKDVVWFRIQSPFHDLDTLSPLVPLDDSLKVQNRTAEWTRSFFEDGTEPDYVLETDSKLNDAAVRRLKEDIKQHNRGRKRRNPRILDNGLKYKATSADPEKAQLTGIEVHEMQRTLVALGVPPSVLGVHIQGETPLTSAADKRFFWEETMLPRLRDFEDTLNRALPEDVWFQFDWRKVKEMMGDPEARSLGLVREVNAGILTVNEARREKGLSDVPWGNTAYLSVGLAPVDSPFRAGRTHEEIAVGFRPAGTATHGEVRQDAEDFPKEEGERMSIDDILEKTLPEPDWDDAVRVDVWKRFLVYRAQIAPDVRKLRDPVRQFVASVAEETKRLLEQEESSFKTITKIDIPPDDFAVEARVVKILPGVEVLRRLAELSLRDPISKVIAKHGKIAAKEARASIQFNLADPEIEHYLATGIGTHIPEGFREKLRQSAVEGVRQALTRTQLEAKLREEVFGAGASEVYVRTVARTEVVTASNVGRVKGFKQSGARKKMWNSVLINTTRDAHELAHGQVVGIDEPFVVGGETLQSPGDPAGSARNVVNCLCWVSIPEEGMAPVTGEEPL